MKKDVSIQIIRIIAMLMLMIVICHILNVSSISILKSSAQFFNNGVYIFLFVSGYLYGKKNITNSKQFLIGRAKRVFIPIYLFIIYISIFHIIDGSFSLLSIFCYMFGVQYFLDIGVVGLTHLWFVSIIMLCYLITVILNKYKNEILKNKKIVLVSTFIMSIVISFFNEKIGQIFFYLLIYLIGYTNSDKHMRISLDIIFFILACVGIVVLRKLYDGQVLYNTIIVSICQIIIAICVFNLLKFLFKKVVQNKIIDYFDKLSFYIYIVHYHLIMGPIYLYNVLNNYILATIVLIFLSFLMANILMNINEKIIKRVKI